MNKPTRGNENQLPKKEIRSIGTPLRKILKRVNGVQKKAQRSVKTPCRRKKRK